MSKWSLRINEQIERILPSGILLVGDILTLVFFSIFFGFGSIPPEWKTTGLVFAVKAFLVLAWLLMGWLFKLFEIKNDFRSLVLKPALLWPAVLLLASGFCFFIFRLFAAVIGGRVSFSILALLVYWLGGLVFVLGWRSFFWLFYRLMTGHPTTWAGKLLKTFPFVLILLAVLVLILEAATLAAARGRIYTLDEVPQQSYGIVFGSGLTANGEPSAVLRDRVITASLLYRQGKIKTIVLSGAVEENGWDEVDVMRDLAVQQGVPDTALVPDHSGSSTFATCTAASKEYNLSKAVLITQKYHAPRALFICRKMGVDSVAVSADRTDYPLNGKVYWWLRELLATSKAWLDVFILHRG